jgi:hypothetical protein
LDGQAFPSQLLRRSNDALDWGGWSGLFGAEEGVAEEEEDAEDPDEGADFAMAAGADFDEGEGEEAKAESGGDAEGERSGDEGHEGGEGFAEIVPFDAGDGAAHERADEDESGSGGVGRNSSDERGAEHGDDEHGGDDDVAEASACSGGDSGGALDVAGDGGGAGESAEHSAECVGEKGAAGAGEFAVAEEAAFFADANEGADVVEEIDEEKDEDEFAEADAGGGAEVEFQKCAGGMREGEEMVRPVAEAERNAEKSDGDDTDKDGAADAPGHQNSDENQAQSCEKNLRIGDFADADEGGAIGDDDFCVAQPDESDEEADAGGGAVFEGVGDAVDDLFADVGEGENQKEEAGEKDDAERGLPGDTAPEDDGVGEVGVEGHAGGEGDGIVGPQAHDERGDGGRNASGEENAFDGHAGFGEDAGVDDDHVGHGHEGGEASEEFAADGGVIFLEMKYALEQTVFLFPSNKKVGHYRPGETRRQCGSVDSRAGQCSTMSRTTLSPTTCAASKAGK